MVDRYVAPQPWIKEGYEHSAVSVSQVYHAILCFVLVTDAVLWRVEQVQQIANNAQIENVIVTTELFSWKRHVLSSEQMLSSRIMIMTTPPVSLVQLPRGEACTADSQAKMRQGTTKSPSHSVTGDTLVCRSWLVLES